MSAEDRTQPPPGFEWTRTPGGDVVRRTVDLYAVQNALSGLVPLQEAWRWRDRMLAVLSGEAG